MSTGRLRCVADFCVGRQVVSWGRGIEAHWKREKIMVYAPDKLKGQVCGLCGNYNDDDRDDWMVGEQCRNDTAKHTVRRHIRQ